MIKYFLKKNSKANQNGFVLAVVLVFIFISVIIIFGSGYIFGRFLNNIEASDVYNDAEIQLNNQKEFLKKYLITTNTDGLGYNTDGVERRDINGDDDDFNGELNDIDGITDDDGDAFKYRIGLIEPDEDTNILLLTPKYFEYANFNINTLSGLVLNTDKSGNYRIEIFDGETYLQEKIINLKKVFKGNFGPGDNNISLGDKKILFNDILAIFIRNTSFGNMSYKLNGINKNGVIIKNFVPVKNKAKNIDYYSNIIIKNNSNNYLIFDKFYPDILENGKIPIAPTYLQGFGSGDTIEFTWDINDISNTGSYYLFRGFDDNVDCKEEYFIAKIDTGYKINSFTGNYNLPGNFYYTICSSNTPGGVGFQDIGRLSNHSNIINLIK